MAISKTKIVQAYIQGLVDIVRHIQSANEQAILLKAKFDAKGVDLSGTNITNAQITAVNNFISNLDALATSSVANAIANKDQPSHSLKALD